ncbi:tyrosine-type recombinase/integrase [Massilia varians]|uniref:phage integrase n=1 Tax=Massilia varians TaxID=457921 RepID=UPI0025562E14|nr:tyrosine-type recombinase/integrase [Massilia varians]MDK6078345.1 tyrosine-type recombinase/integrase [Massilia varians]
MSIQKTVSGRWQVNIQPGGRAGKRLKKTFDTKAEALAWERHVRSKVQVEPEWLPPKADTRKLSDLVELWYKHHGIGLKDGEGRKRILVALTDALRNPAAEAFGAQHFADYRSVRLAAGISANTLNHEHAYLRAVFNEAKRLGHWKKPNPLSALRPFKVDEKELTFLSLDQISDLLERLKNSTNVHVSLVAQICLATGARWSEAETIKITNLRGGTIQFAQTKSSKTRAVPIDESLMTVLVKHHSTYANDDRLFTSCYSAFRSAVEDINLQLPPGQLTHVLRHTFASHFMMNGGNIITLQRVLGHHSLTMTMRYAHLSPEHFQQAKELNPLTQLNRAANTVDPSLNRRASADDAAGLLAA